MQTASDLRIGDRYGSDRDGNPIHIKALHEVCGQLRFPHVHVVTTQQSLCLSFGSPVGRQEKKSRQRGNR